MSHSFALTSLLSAQVGNRETNHSPLYLPLLLFSFPFSSPSLSYLFPSFATHPQVIQRIEKRSNGAHGEELREDVLVLIFVVYFRRVLGGPGCMIKKGMGKGGNK